MTKIATIILNRNLPKETDRLYEHVQKNNKNITDIYVVESGSSLANLSKYCTWHANWKEAKEKGLLYSTLQHEADICPSFEFGNCAFASLTK